MVACKTTTENAGLRSAKAALVVINYGLAMRLGRRNQGRHGLRIDRLRGIRGGRLSAAWRWSTGRAHAMFNLIGSGPQEKTWAEGLSWSDGTAVSRPEKWRFDTYPSSREG